MADYQSNADLTVDVPDISQLAGFVNDDKLKKRILKIWAQRLRTFLLREFNKNSKGGGKWKPLKRPRKEPKPARINKRDAEQVSLKKHFENQAILVDTGALRMALNPTSLKPGSLEQYRLDSQGATLTIGWGGSELNPPSKTTGKSKKTPHVTIAELAVIHHYGTRTIPSRPLLVEPDNATQNSLLKIAETEIEKYGRLE